MRRLIVAMVVVLLSLVLSVPAAHGRAIAHPKIANRPGGGICMVCWVSGEGVSTSHLRGIDLDADCGAVLLYIGLGNSRPAVCIVLIECGALAQGLYGRHPAPIRHCRGQWGCTDPCRRQPAWVHKGRRLVDTMRCILGW